MDGRTCDLDTDLLANSVSHHPLKRRATQMPHEQRTDWSHLIVNAAVSATVGAVVAHLFREHGERGRAEREAEQRRRDAQRVQLLRAQQAQVEQLLRGLPRGPVVSPPGSHPQAPYGLPFPAAPSPPFAGQAPTYPWPSAPAHSMPAYAAPQPPAPHVGAMPSLPSRSLFDDED